MKQRTLLFCLAIAGLFGCGDDDGGTDAGGTDATLDASSPARPEFVISQILVTPSGFQSFAAFASSLDASAEVDASASVPLPGTSLASAGPTPGSFLVSSGEAPEVFRYDVAADGTVSESGPVSFAGRGVAIGGIPPKVVTVSETKAYYLDTTSLRGFVFDPSALTITSEFSLEALAPISEDNEEVVIAVQVIEREADILLPVIYRDLEESSSEQLGRVLSIRTSDDVVTVLEDRRCGYLDNVFQRPNGDVYVASGVFNGASFGARPDANGPSCILRIRAGAMSFDPDFIGELETLTGTPLSGGLIPGPANTAFVLAYDETAVPRGETFDELSNAPAWRTVRIDLDAPMQEGQTVDTLPLRSAANSPVQFGTESYDSVTAADFGSTTVYRYDLSPGPEVGITFPGVQLGLIRLE